MRANFEKLSNRTDWADPNSSTSPNRFTVHRQKQLVKVLKVYGGEKIPFAHFTNEIVDDPVKRNAEVFPVVFAYICGILKIEGEQLVKPKSLVLGERDFDRNEAHWV